MKILIYGASDDLVCTDVGGELDEHQAYGANPWVGLLTAPNGDALAVHAWWHGREGLWHVGAGPAPDVPGGDEDGRPMPDWLVRVRRSSNADRAPSYSAVLEIDAPDGTRLTAH